MRKHSAGTVTLIVVSGAVLALSFCRFGAPSAAAQGFVTPTPLPAIVATQQAAAQSLGNVQAQNARADQLDAQAAEIRRNADAQAQQAAQAYADARAATAAQNAAAIGEAIGRGEAALSQLKDSADGALKLNAEQSAIINSLYISVTQMTGERDQALRDKANLQRINTALQANNETLTAQAQHNSTSANVLSIVPGFLTFLLLIGLLVLTLGIRQWQHARSGAATVTARDDEQDEDDPPIEGEYRNETP